MASCGTYIVDELRKSGETFFELCENLSFPAETIRACLNVFLKNGVAHNLIGKYVLEDGVGDFVVPSGSLPVNRKKYRSVVPAKCNLSLAVVGKGEKLHELDMLFCPFDLVWDEAEFVPDEENSLKIEDFTMQPDFDAERFAAEMKPKVDKLAKKLGVSGAVKIKKGVPVGAGLGGSTACLVAVYYAFKKYADEKGLKFDVSAKYLTSLSSDFPAMALARACRVRGVGEKVEPIEENVQIVFTGFKVADGGSDTAAVYKKFDEKDALLQLEPPATVEDALENPRNDLFAPACKLNKEIKKVYDAMKSQKPNFVIMTGSGSGIIALDYQIV